MYKKKKSKELVVNQYKNKDNVSTQSDMEDVTEWLADTDIDSNEELLKLVSDYNDYGE